MTSRRTKISPKSRRGLGHVTPTILAVRLAILATAWLFVSFWHNINVWRTDRQTDGRTRCDHYYPR